MNVGHREPDTRTSGCRGSWTLCLVNQVEKITLDEKKVWLSLCSHSSAELFSVHEFIIYCDRQIHFINLQEKFSCTCPIFLHQSPLCSSSRPPASHPACIFTVPPLHMCKPPQSGLCSFISENTSSVRCRPSDGLIPDAGHAGSSASQWPPALSSVCSSVSLNQTASHPCFSCFVLPRHTFHTLLRSVWTAERRHLKASTAFISTWSHSHKHATFLLSFPGKISTTIYCPPPAHSSHCRWNCACNLFLTQCIYYVIINGVLLFYLFTIIVK